MEECGLWAPLRGKPGRSTDRQVQPRFLQRAEVGLWQEEVLSLGLPHAYQIQATFPTARLRDLPLQPFLVNCLSKFAF